VCWRAGISGEGIVNLLQQLNDRSSQFTQHNDNSRQDWEQQQQQQQQQPGQQMQGGPTRKQQLLCLKLGPPAEQQQQQDTDDLPLSQFVYADVDQQQQQEQQIDVAGWRADVFGRALDQLHPEEPLMQHLRVLELHGLSTPQQAEVSDAHC
jgi:hypothetical protein